MFDGSGNVHMMTMSRDSKSGLLSPVKLANVATMNLINEPITELDCEI